MASPWSAWQARLKSSKTTEDVASIARELESVCPSDAEWAKLCEAIMKQSWPEAMLEDAKEFAEDKKKIAAALLDNFFWAGHFLVLANADRSLPALPDAAFNKHAYRGYADECALVRFLTWAGFDPKAANSSGQTALHYMASWKNSPFSNPRAVKFLLNAGADPNARNKNGDSPLTYLCGNARWTEALRESAFLLLNAGADPQLKSNDGATPLSLLQDAQKTRHQDERNQVITEMERIILGGAVKKSTTGQPGSSLFKRIFGGGKSI